MVRMRCNSLPRSSLLSESDHLRAAATIQVPHILTLYASGDAIFEARGEHLTISILTRLFVQYFIWRLRLGHPVHGGAVRASGTWITANDGW
eukprot:SAG31_NODE_10871_length_1088_cov_1.974722_3_plen_92_part_01